MNWIKKLFALCDHNWEHAGRVTKHETYHNKRTGKILGEYDVYVCKECLKTKHVDLY